MQTDWLVFAGIGLIMVGILLVVVGSVLGSGDAEVRSGGVIFVGPIPIVFGNDKQAILVAAGAALLLLVASFLFLRRVPA